MKTIFITVAMALLYNIAYGHHLIRGTVVNAEDRTPLIGATIQIEGLSRGTVTDAFGHFELVIEESSATLVVSYLGFSEKKVTVSEHEGQITVMIHTGSRGYARHSWLDRALYLRR